MSHSAPLLVLLIVASVAVAHADNPKMTDSRTEQAIALMQSYAQRTGLISDQARTRYLWTDAFAVCNYIGLARTTGEQRYTQLALKLVDQVHHTLGRHRQDDPRTGWISGLDDDEGEQHPTHGGLRIGKALPERTPDEAFDQRLEWDRDGQYFHYLSKWMHALDQVSRATAEPRFNHWARELDVSAFEAFSVAPASSREPRRMVWKMSIDLTHALVPSMGAHDPLDGYITSLQLATTAAALPPPDAGPKLEHATNEFARMISNGEWATDDPLGLGGLLADAYRVQQLMHQPMDKRAQPVPGLLENLLDAAITGLRYYAQSGEHQQPAQYRLAFRELGLAIGLHAVEFMQRAFDNQPQHETASPKLRAQLKALLHYNTLRNDIESFWLKAENQNTDTWLEHRDINEVMLATSLAPEGFLELFEPDVRQ